MIIGVLNAKGGVAKTMSSMALATAASRRELNVTVIDTDPQGTATNWALRAEDNGEELPFAVVSRNKAEIRRMKSRRPDADGGVVIIDCPPDGAVLDETIDVADFVVIPARPAEIDLQQTILACEACARQGTDFAVLMTMVRANTVSSREFRQAVLDSGAGIFDVSIPLLEEIPASFGHRFRSNLHGYGEAWNEIVDAVLENDGKEEER
ncbi:ParA family protein [Bifidobacterium aerophilum]|uniref:AAA family ATPase n=1 Tax=Bifidobacterium aerophilum TaxID=1798155 RepID=A0A6N9Z855_9BIFI|nr:ParA family protein [Bifidobacterium aerophilum]NEG90606.1 AAA family ATPase [Bifidobacterium aerophilum]